MKEENNTLKNIVNYETALTGGFVTYETLKDLFALLDDDEYGVYKEYATKFNNSKTNFTQMFHALASLA